MTIHTNDLFSVNRQGALAILTLNYGPGNETLGHAAARALQQTLDQLNVDTSCGAIVLTGDADFCAAGDLSLGEETGTDLIALRGTMRTAAVLYRDMRRGPKPIIAAVEGKAWDAGLALVAACDYVVAADNASFRCNAVSQGTLPEAGLLWSLPEKVGDAKARELMFLGREMAASEALSAGLASELVAPGGALAQAIAVAQRFEALPLVTVALIKAGLFNGNVSMADGLRMELDLNPLVRQAEDHQEAVAAFMEKRKPNFVGN